LIAASSKTTLGFIFAFDRGKLLRPTTQTTTHGVIIMSGSSSTDDESTTLLLSNSYSLTSTSTQLIIDAAIHEAISNAWQVTVCISDAGGVPLHVRRMDGAFAASYEIAVGKARTAALFRKPTGVLEDSANVNTSNGGAISRTALLSAPFVLMRGGVPIVINGQCVGAVGVSGVKPNEDERVAMAACDALLSSIGSLNSKI
jgi:glc operon protein GlcG